MLVDVWIVFWIVLLSTFLQKYYFLVLHKIKSKSIFLQFIFWFIIRFWIIIHEFMHLFFWFLSWNKIQEIHLFDKNGWKVIFQTKNYIWALSQYWLSLRFIFWLIFNQIWLFLTSFWPLFFWVVATFFFFWYFEIYTLDDFKNNFSNFDFIFMLVIYSIFIPSFILSYEDISIFFISKQENILATIFWSIINILIFVWFLFTFSSFFKEYFIFFFLVFLGLFLLQILIYLIISLIIKIKNILIN